MMNDLQSFDFSSLKKMTVDSLILMCQGYVKQYLSESDAIRFEDAYKNSEYGEVKHILEETLKKVNGKTKKSEFQKVKQIVLSEFPGAENLFESSDENGGGKNDNMGTGSGLVAVAVIQLIRQMRYRSDDEYREKVDVEINDERNKYISTKAWAWAGYLFVLIIAVGVIASKALGYDEMSMYASWSLCILLVLYWGSYWVLRKKY
jgi:uncharacterized membrane protein